MSQQTQAPHDALDRFFDWIRNLGVRRRSESKWIGGVCSGVADRFRVDPVVVRAGLVLLTIFGGAGLVAYLIAWLLLPDSTDVSAAERALRHGDTNSIILLVVTAILVFSGFPWWFGHSGFWSFPWGLLIVGGVFWFIVRRSRQGSRPSQPSQPWQAAPVADPPWGSAPGQSSPAYESSPPYQSSASSPSAPSTASSGSKSAKPAKPAKPAKVATVRRRSGGGLLVLLAIGLAFVGYGISLWIGDRQSFSGDHHVIAMAVALALIGLLLVGLGVAGWRSGFTGFLAIVLAVFTLAAGALGHVDRFGGRMGNAVWRPTTISSGTSYHLLAGQGRLDFADLTPVSGQAAPTLPVSIGAGQLQVRVPDGMTVRVVAHVGAGVITAPGDVTDGPVPALPHRPPAATPGPNGTGNVNDNPNDNFNPNGNNDDYNGTDVSRTVVVGTGTPSVVVDAEVLVGQITIIKETS